MNFFLVVNGALKGVKGCGSTFLYSVYIERTMWEFLVIFVDINPKPT